MKSWIWLTGTVAANALLAGATAGPPGKFQPDWLDDPLYRACDALVSWWPADGHAFDLAGPHHGKRVGPVGFDKGYRGAAFSFPGDQGHVAAGGPADLADTFTLAVWVEPAGERRLTPAHAHQYAGTQGQRYAVYPTYGSMDGKRAGAGISVGTNGVGLFEHTHDNLPCVLAHDTPIKDWTHVAVVYAKGQPTLYINGAAVKTGVRSPWSVVPGTRFGDAGSPAYRYGPYLGRIDEPMLFRRALTEGEIKAVLRASQPGGPGAPGRKALPLSEAAFAALWGYLSGERAPRALFAVRRLAASGDEAVRRLRTVLLPPVEKGGLTVEELIRRLDDKQFRERERAMQFLLQAGEAAVPKLRARLKAGPTAEARARIEQLLRRLEKKGPTPEQMRGVRAVTALGRIDTAASRALLAELAEGAEEAPQGVAARAALRQLDGGRKTSEK
jgi:hypothetical protein